MMIGKISSISLYITVLLVSPAALHGQETIVDSSGVVSVDSLALSARVSERADSLMRAADSFRKEYDFTNALAVCREALELPVDSLERIGIEDSRLLCENVYRPSVVARKRVSLNDFFLYYPLEDKSWHPVPNVLDGSSGHPFSRAVYAGDGDREIYFSARDEGGSRNLMCTAFNDSLWTAPSLLNEHLTSSGDEIYPMLSPDGKSLYFSSSGLYGMGGYDIYVSSWDDESGDWGVPVNLGFPYSSPYDDFLFVNTDDGRYTVFASNRDCTADSVNVYVLEYDNMPISGAVEDMAELRRIMSLEPAAKDSVAPAEDDGIPENVDTRRYMAKMEEVRSLKDSLYIYGQSLDKERVRFAMSDDVEERAVLTAEILRREEAIPMMQDSLDRATALLQQIEMEFLFSGVVIDPEKVYAASEAAYDEDVEYSFVRMNIGDTLDMAFEEPADEFDYSFMILPEGRFAKDNTIPSGVVYQIQIFSVARPASVAQLRGLSPVFVSGSSSGKYTYSVGVFRTYNDVLSNLNRVRKVGFKSAYIVAYIDGKSVSVATARAMEKKK